MRYGIAIDLKICFGCNACTVICKQRHGTPPGTFWGKVHVNEVGNYPNARREYLPTLCMHCAEPACVDACPVGASYQREDGIVLIDQKMCVGCRYCMVSCPYEARCFDDGSEKSYFPGQDTTAYEKAYQDNVVKGTVSKCDMCYDRVDEGLLPACVQTCPPGARVFGDLDDPDSEVSRLILSRGGYQLSPERGTNPSIYYLAE